MWEIYYHDIGVLSYRWTLRLQMQPQNNIELEIHKDAIRLKSGRLLTFLTIPPKNLLSNISYNDTVDVGSDWTMSSPKAEQLANAFSMTFLTAASGAWLLKDQKKLIFLFFLRVWFDLESMLAATFLLFEFRFWLVTTINTSKISSMLRAIMPIWNKSPTIGGGWTKLAQVW